MGMNDAKVTELKNRAFKVLTLARDGYPGDNRCNCGDPQCEYNFPSAKARSWAQGIVLALNAAGCISEAEAQGSDIRYLQAIQREG